MYSKVKVAKFSCLTDEFLTKICQYAENIYNTVEWFGY